MGAASARRIATRWVAQQGSADLFGGKHCLPSPRFFLWGDTKCRTVYKTTVRYLAGKARDQRFPAAAQRAPVRHRGGVPGI